MKARDPKTGASFILQEGQWRRADRGEQLPAWHPLVVPGEAWTRHYREQRQRERAGPLERVAPDPAIVEPRKFRD